MIYHFASQAQALALSDAQTACVRGPINYVELERTLMALTARLSGKSATAPGAQIAPPRFSKAVLSRVAALPASIVCECPRHIAELIVSLSDFEAYSAACEDRNDRDAAIHAYLKQTAGAARSAFEEALETVAEHEQLSLAEDPAV